MFFTALKLTGQVVLNRGGLFQKQNTIHNATVCSARVSAGSIEHQVSHITVNVRGSASYWQPFIAEQTSCLIGPEMSLSCRTCWLMPSGWINRSVAQECSHAARWSFPIRSASLFSGCQSSLVASACRKDFSLAGCVSVSVCVSLCVCAFSSSLLVVLSLGTEGETVSPVVVGCVHGYGDWIVL